MGPEAALSNFVSWSQTPTHHEAVYATPLLDEDSTLLFYIKKPLYSRGKSNKREREFRVDLPFAHNLPLLRRGV